MNALANHRRMPTICQGCGYICDGKRPLDDILYYCMIFHLWLCHECYNLPGPKAWAERRNTIAASHEV